MANSVYTSLSENAVDKKQTADNYISQKEIVNRPQEFTTAEAEGKTLFSKNCVSCHVVEVSDNFLAGFESRGPRKNRRELYKWIRNPQDYSLHDATGYTAGLKEKYGVSMLASPNLSDRDLEKIVDYLIKANKQQAYFTSCI